MKIQLVTTSDGKKLGGIRLSTTRHLVHLKREQWKPECNRARCNRGEAFRQNVICRRKACLVPGYNEVDKLEKGLAMYSPSLN